MENLPPWAKKALLDQLEDIISTKLQTIRECVQVIQLILKKEHKDTVSELEKKLSDLTNYEQKGEIFESQVQYIDIISDTLPNMVRSTFFTSIYSFIEQSLVSICLQLQKNFNYKIELKDLTGKGCERCRNYLIKVVGIKFPEDNWPNIKFYMDLRNHIVHTGTHIFSKDEKSKKLIEKINNKSLLEIDGIPTDTDRANIIFSDDFLIDVLKNISNFLSAIFCSINEFDSIKLLK